MLLQMDAVCFPLEFIFLKKVGIQEFTSLMKHQFVVYIYKIYSKTSNDEFSSVITPTYKINFKLQVFVSIFVSNNFQLRMNFILVQTHFNIGRTKDLSRVMSALKTPLRAQIWLWTYWTLSHTLWVTTGFSTGCSYFVSRDHKSHNPDHSDDPSFSVMTFRFWSDRNSK